MSPVVIVFIALSQVVLSLFVLQRGYKNLTNILFFGIGLSTLAWAIFNYLTISFLDSTELINIVRMILFCVVIQNFFFYLFAKTFPSSRWQYSKKGLAIYGVFTLITALATLSPFVFTAVEVNQGIPTTEAGPGILLFIAHASFSIIQAFRSLISKLRSASGLQKNQLLLLLIASVLTWIVVPITNFAITPLLKTTFFIEYAPLYTLLFASIIGFAIVSQKLFDIRAAVARSVAYLLSLGMLGLVYGAIIYVISVIFAGSLSDSVLRAYFIGLALFSAIFFPPIKQYFDRLSNKLFYRDAYEPQKFLDDLNKSLVSDIEIGILLRHTAKAIEENLGCSYCLFGVHETEMDPIRIIGTNDSTLTKDSFIGIHKLIQEQGLKEVVTDELDDSNKLKRALLKNDVAVTISLQVGTGHDLTTIAYLMLGPKKSGNIYSKQDLRIIDIIADELVIAIQNSLRFEEIQGFAITLQAKVNEATAKLKRTNEKLKEMDETKDEFISMASHQLRTPLTSVKGYLSMVLEGDAGKLTVMQQELLNQAYVSSQRMVYLIADLLNVSRLKTGKFIIDALPCNLADVIESEIAQLTEVAKSKKVTLSYDKPKDFPTLLLDETKIRQVIMNFADNAIYYTQGGGKVEIQLKEDKSNIYFLVKDNGMGVPKDEHSHLFTKFYRARNARQARPDGTGLGLFMAKKVVNAQGGNIVFESKEGRGSTFGFTFKKSGLSPIDKQDEH